MAARRQAMSSIKNCPRQPPIPEDQGKRPRGIKKQQASRNSLRLQAIRQSHKQSLTKSNCTQEVHTPLSPPTSNIPEDNKRPQPVHKSSTSRKRKRGQEQEVEHPSSRTQEQPPSKGLQTSSSICINNTESNQVPTSDVSVGNIDPLQHWVQTGKWRKEDFEQDSQVRKDFERGKVPEQRDWLLEHYIREPFGTMHPLAHLHAFLARKKSSSSLRRKKPQSTSDTPSDSLPRENQSSQYGSAGYEIRLEQKGSYMREYDGTDDDNKEENMKTLCKTLLNRDQAIPQDSLFRDDLFKRTCEKVRNRNEAIIVQDITRLIVPSAENLAIYGAKHLNHLFESANEGWSNMIEFEGTLPQPDYSVGFGRSAFTQEQLNKLKPFVGEPGSRLATYFMATMRMFFPFLTCEVKCGAAALDIADRQNAQNMSVALRALVVLFRSVKREEELHREILAFSISHDHRSVRIYGHYPVIEGAKTTFYRHNIRGFDFIDDEHRWTAYKFTKNVYDHWMPILHKKICSAIDDLPADINFDFSQSSFFQSTPQSSQLSNAEPILGEDDSRSSFLASQEVTPTTSFTQATEPVFKKPRNQRASQQRH